MRHNARQSDNINCFSKIQLPVVGQKITRLNIFRKLKLDLNSFFAAKTIQIWWVLFTNYI